MVRQCCIDTLAQSSTLVSARSSASIDLSAHHVVANPEIRTCCVRPSGRGVDIYGEHRAYLVVSVCVLAEWETMAFAQSASSVRGTISEQSGSVVPGASVALSKPQTGFSRTTHSAADGVYQFANVPPGTYSQTVNAAGFEASRLATIDSFWSTLRLRRTLRCISVPRSIR